MQFDLTTWIHIRCAILSKDDTCFHSYFCPTPLMVHFGGHPITLSPCRPYCGGLAPATVTITPYFYGQSQNTSLLHRCSHHSALIKVLLVHC